MSDMEVVQEKSYRSSHSSGATTISGPVWDTLMEQFNKERKELENYLNKRDKVDEKITLEKHPVIAYLNETLFPVLCEAMILMLEKVRDEKSCYRQKSAFHGIDFLSEYLYNKNPRYPERSQNWTYVFDMDWVNKYLSTSPRPYYPFSLIWTNEYAALKIQSYMRGYWVRRSEAVQEMRIFWKDYKLTKKAESII